MTTIDPPLVESGEQRVRRTAPFGARLAATGLVLGAAAATLSATLAQVIGSRDDSVAARIAHVNDHPALATAMAVAGTVSAPFMLIGFLTAAHLLRRRARRTGAIAGVVLTIGMFGYLAVQVIETVELSAMLDPTGHDVATFLRDSSSPLPAVLFGVPFMFGVLLGTLTLTIGLLVTGAGVPRWIPAFWLAFLVLDLAAGPVGPVDPHWLYLLGAVGLAAHVLRDGGRAWANG